MTLSDEEKIRVLEKRIRRLELMIGRGAMAQYLFCPSLNCWLPGQCDEQGRQVIDPSDLDTRYLKVDGSNKMKGHLDMDIYNIKLLTGLLMLGEEGSLSGKAGNIGQEQLDSIWFWFVDKFLVWDALRVEGKLIMGVDAYLEGDFNLDSYALFNAGHITFLDGKKLQWSDINLYRFDANWLKSDDWFDAYGYDVDGVMGATGSFTTVDGKTVTVVRGLITSIV